MISIGCDHGGLLLKKALIEYMEENGIGFYDRGCYDENSVDYAPIAFKVCNDITRKKAEKGVLVCSTGIGISMAANKVKSIRAAVCTDVFTAEMTRKHNDANVLCMGGKIVNNDLGKEILSKFLSTEFEGGRHERRIAQIALIEDNRLEIERED